MSITTTKSTTYIREIKKRTAYLVFSFFFTFLLSYWKWYQLAYIFLLSFSNNQEFEKNFIFTDVYSAFSSTIWICLATCSLIILPLITYQIICFLSPSWYNHERRKYCFYIVLVLVSWYIYISFVNSLIIPQLCAFLLEFQVNTSCLNITVQPKIDAYLSWAASISLLATFLFLCVMLFYIVLQSKLINISKWSKQRKSCVFLSLLIGAFLSPPELGNQILLASVFYTISELIIWISLIRERLLTIRHKYQK